MKRKILTALTIPIIGIFLFACASSLPDLQEASGNRILFQTAEDPSTIDQMLELSKNQLVMVDFYSPRCPHCKKLAPTLDEVARLRPHGVKYFKVDIDAQKQIASYFKAWPIPYILLLKDGRQAQSIRGVQKQNRYTEAIDRLLQAR